MNDILEIKNLNSGYGKRQILFNVEISVKKGDKILLIGANGSGKSTLLKTIVGIINPYSGSIIFKGKNITGMPVQKIINLGIGYLPQTNNIFPSLTVEENLRLACFYESISYFRKRIEFILYIFPFLRDKIEKRAGFLSGGERQSLAISMTLMRDMELLILDEPTAGLSPKASRDVLEGIKKADKEKSFTMVMVEHNIRYMEGLYKRAIIMREGEVVEEMENISREFLEKHFFKTDEKK